jgi:hypothetical protein
MESKNASCLTGPLDQVLGLPMLEVLSLRTEADTFTFAWCDTWLVKLVNGNRLRKVRIRGSYGVTGTFLQQCGNAVTDIDLSRCPDLEIDVLTYMQGFRGLTSLNLSDITRVNDEWAAAISVNLQTLTHVSLRLSFITDTGVSFLALLPSLLDLDISDNISITSDSLEALSTHTTLQSLDVSGTFVLAPGDIMAIVPNLNTRIGRLRLTVNPAPISRLSKGQRRDLENAHVDIIQNARLIWPCCPTLR